MMIGLAGFYALVVVVSFSRGFWISGIFAMVVILWLLDKRKLALFTVYGIIAAILFTLAVQVVFPDKATFIFKVLKARLASSATGTQDLSLLSRVYETKSLLLLLQQYPISGFGLGSTFFAYDPISKTFYTATFIHNGYLYIWLKLGFAFFIAYFAYWAYMMRRAYRIAKTTNVPMAKILAAGCVASLTAFWLLNVTSSISEGRDGFYCLSMCFAAMSFAEHLSKQEQKQRESK
jgi:O-antigen ligase